MARLVVGEHRRPMLRFFKVLLLPCHLQNNLRVPDEVALALGGEGVALVVGALGKVWPVEVRRVGGDGVEEKDAFVLARGWEEFARAHGVAAGWFLVFRHEGRGVLSVKAFDSTLCLRDFSTPCADLVSKSRRPQFISILLHESLTKMKIPTQFARNHIKNNASQTATMVISPLGKLFSVALEQDQYRNVFLGSGWAEFVGAYDLSVGNVLLFRYEGNMVFSVKVFDPNGCQKMYPSTTAASGHISDGKCLNDIPQGKKIRLGASSINQKKKSHSEPKHLITKSITARTLSHGFIMGHSICTSMGVPGSCTITLKISTTTTRKSKRSWKVAFRTASTYCYFQSGWKEFCQDNNVRVGDVCSINILEKTLWHVSIKKSTLS